MALGSCNKGRIPMENQDAILIRYDSTSGLFIVSDGVGGSKNGAAASTALTETFSRWWCEDFLPHRNAQFIDLFDSLKDFLESVNYELWHDYGEGNCCATVVLLFIHDRTYGYLSVGDSRIYHSRRGKIGLLTRDDTWENLPNTNGDVHNGKIVSAVGGHQYPDYSSATDQLERRDCFMLCSDGIYKFVDETMLTKMLRTVHYSLFLKERHVDAFIQEAEKNQSNDNYSIILVKT